MNSTWGDFFNLVENRPFFIELRRKIDEAYGRGVCYPPKEKMLNAFRQCPFEKTKVVIIGQDPYPNPGQAMGLSFSVPSGVMLPPSLRNIYKEIEDEGFGLMNENDGDLTYLAHQGVLLLNAYLSVEEGKPTSHQWKEYEMLMTDVLAYLSKKKENLVFLFWGGFAKKYASFASNPRHLKLFSAHPSPLSANRGGWFGNGHFKKANEYLIQRGEEPIDWCNSMFKL